MQSPPFPRYLVPPRSKYSPQHHVLKHPQLPFLPQCQRPSYYLIHSPNNLCLSLSLTKKNNIVMLMLFTCINLLSVLDLFLCLLHIFISFCAFVVTQWHYLTWNQFVLIPNIYILLLTCSISYLLLLWIHGT